MEDARRMLDQLSRRTRIGNMTMRSFPAIFNQTVGQPSVPKRSLRKAAAFTAGLGLSMLCYPLHAAPASSGDTVQGLYDTLLSMMKTAGYWVRAVVSHSCSQSFAAASTSLRWRGCRS